jgi:hypothetical protein
MNKELVVRLLSQLVVLLQAQLANLKSADTTKRVYEEAEKALGTHITLNDSVPATVGCAEAVSAILQRAGCNIPAGGIAGTASLKKWLDTNATLVSKPSPGCVVVSPTGESTMQSPHGHTGIVCKYGIASNDSNTGLFHEGYTMDSWEELFRNKLGFPVYFYQVK